MSTKPRIQRKKQKVIRAADLWCGGGGSSTGMRRAIEKLGYRLELTAANHWEIAVATHSKNHPDARHLCKAIDSINPLEIFQDRKLDLLWASPECVHHSRARGGKPRDDQKRADAWDLQRWIEKLYVKTLIVENVEEFVDWGPLDENGQPLKSKKGTYFNKFIEFLNILYTVEWRILNCADYGDPTTRKRFFLIAKRGKNKKIFFPEPTHASRKVLDRCQPNIFEPEKELAQWIPARDIINWSLKGKNVFGRKKPLSENTMKRINSGLRKYSGIDIPERKVYEIGSLSTFLPKKKKKNKGEPEFEPVTTLYREQFKKQLEKNDHLITPTYEKIKRDEKGKIIEHISFPCAETLERIRAMKQREADYIYQISPIKFDLNKINPFVLQNEGFFRGNAPGRDISEPVPTVTSRGGGALVEPFLLNQKGRERRMRALDDPTFTQTTSPNQQYLVQPYMVNLSHTKNNDGAMYKDLSEPIPTICGKGMLGIVEPFLVKYHGNETGAHSVEEPVSTVTTKDRLGVAEPFFISYHSGKSDGGVNRSHELENPLPTLDTSNRFGIVEPVLIPCHHGKNDSRAHSLSEPVPTITKVDGMAMAEPYLVQYFGGMTAVPVDEPVPTITANYEHYGLARPYIVKFNNNQDAQDIEDPLATITTKDKFGIGQPFMIQFYGERDGQTPRSRSVDAPLWTVTPQVRMGIVEPFLVKLEDVKGKVIHGLLLLELGAILIINFRMLHPKELAAAMSFPEDYYFHGNRDQIVKQIGNAVPTMTAEALVSATLEN